MSAAAFGPLPAGVWLEVEWPELVHAEDGFGLAFFGDDLAVGDRVQVLHAGLLDRVVWIMGARRGFQALKRDAFLAKQHAQALVADVVDHPLSDQELRQLGQAPGRKRQAVLGRLDLATFLISRRSGSVNVFGRPPLYFG